MPTVSRSWNSQPDCLSTVSPQWASSVAFLWSGAQAESASFPQQPYFTSSNSTLLRYSATPEGIAQTTSTSSSLILYEFATIPTPSARPFSILTQFRIKSVPASDRPVITFRNPASENASITLRSTGNIRGTTIRANTDVDSDATFAANDLVTALYTGDAGDFALWINGVKQSTVNTGVLTSFQARSTCRIYGSDVYVVLGACFNRRLYEQEIYSLFDNPWQVFTPRKIWIPSSASSGNTHTFAVSGGVTFSGAAPQIRSRVAVPSGGVTFSGTASQLRTRLLPSDGGVTFSGSAPIVNDNTYIINPAGGVTFGGTAPELREKVLAPTGGVTFGGSARLTFLPVGGVTTNDMDRISVGVARKVGVS